MPSHRQPVPADYAHILRVIQDRPDANMIQTILLRSMSQAIYGPDNKGHFGLAYEAYAHFTSPIRRYPDLLVHRAIKNVLSKKPVKTDESELARTGEHCSMTERRADDATNEVTDWLKCEFMLDKVGQIFPGTVSGVTSFGVFVELTDIYVEGLVHISNLPEDYYQFDPIKHVLLGSRSGKSFSLGDPIKVQVARVDLDQRTIDFEPAEGGRSSSRKKRKDNNFANDERKTNSRKKKRETKKPNKKKKRNQAR